MPRMMAIWRRIPFEQVDSLRLGSMGKRCTSCSYRCCDHWVYRQAYSFAMLSIEAPGC